MMNILDLIKKTLEGPPMSEDDFNLKVLIPSLMEINKKYGFKYDPDNPVNTDDEQADSLFAAAVDLILKTGVYCVDTNRVIQFTRQEVMEAVKSAPKVAHHRRWKRGWSFRYAHGPMIPRYLGFMWDRALCPAKRLMPPTLWRATPPYQA